MYGKVTKNLGFPSWASASNVPSFSHWACTEASSFRSASRRALDLGGAGGGVAMAWACVLFVLLRAARSDGVCVRYRRRSHVPLSLRAAQF